MEGLRDVFIRNLKHYRKMKNLRQLDLSFEIGKGANYINSIENSKYFPSPETIEQIAQILGIDPMRLFDRDEPKADGGRKIDAKSIKERLESDVLRCIERAFEPFR